MSFANNSGTNKRFYKKPKTFICFCIGVALLVFAYLFIIHIAEQQLLKEVKQIALKSNLNKQEAQTSRQKLENIIKKTNVNTLSLSKAAFPPPPPILNEPVSAPKLDAAPSLKKAGKYSNADIKSLLNKPSAEVLSAAKKRNLKEDKRNKISPTEKLMVQQKFAQNKQKNKQDIYKQLSSDVKLDLQLALPSTRAEREKLINYLYLCAGAELATLNGREITYLSPKHYSQKSKWLRIVQGQLSAKESAWAGKASAYGQYVRLFPQAIDMKLSQHIAVSLNGQNLMSLRGQYSLVGDQLTLSKLVLNGQAINESWLLFSRKC